VPGRTAGAASKQHDMCQVWLAGRESETYG